MRSRVGRAWARWDAFVVVLVAALAVGGLILRTPGVYVAQVDVVLLTPLNGDNGWDGRSNVLTQLAGITARSVSKNLSAASVVSDDVSLAEQGVAEGWQVRHPNEGGQWDYAFSKPVLDVQATGPNPTVVLDELAGVIARIRADISERERAINVASEQDIRVVVSPLIPQVVYNGGDRHRALAAVMALSLLLASFANHAARKYRRARNARRSGDGDRSQRSIVPEGQLVTSRR